jgi:lipopolysaccharide biosynthesis protein
MHGYSLIQGPTILSGRQRPARVIAFHLPQFHPIPENDRWWGKGFTEWTNVAKAGPLFRGHDQPRLPADLGFYDLRLPEARAAQAELAQSYGIEGFCYWHYWFHGRRLLEGPVSDILASGQPDFPFCLAWANESWSRSWLGDDREVLIEQTYSAEDDRAHARWLARACADPRYIQIHGRPMIVIYKPLALPDPRRTTDIFRHEFERLGLPEPYLVGIDAHRPLTDMRELGFDMTEHHEPQLGALGPDAFSDASLPSKFRRNLRRGILSSAYKIYSYAEAVRLMVPVRPAFAHFPCCFVGWDNTARRGRHAIVMVDATPDLFREQLSLMVHGVLDKHPQERVVFINAWNEWAEGMYLEPDQKRGHAYLESIGSVLAELSGSREACAPAGRPRLGLTA